MQRLALLLVTTAALSGCIVEHERVIRERSAELPAPPPPPDERRVERSYDDSAPGSDVEEVDDEAPIVERDVDVGIFYSRLSPWGHWVFVAPYGRVWVPAVGYGWRPYYYGRWVLTDWGWTFVSDDPWGWAAYHYGRWNWGVGVGWYWVPGAVWAPAWVQWRYGPGWVTWCPMGPSGVYFGYTHPAWVAVREQHFTRPIATVAVSANATGPIVHEARPLEGPHASPARTGQFGPPVARVQSATGQAFHPVNVHDAIERPRATPLARGGLERGREDGARDPMRSPANPRARTDASPGPRARVDSGSGGPRVRDESGFRRNDGENEPRRHEGSGWRRGDDGAPRTRGGGSSVERAPRPRGGEDGAAPHGGGAPRVRGGEGGGGRGEGGRGSSGESHGGGGHGGGGSSPHVGSGKSHGKD